MSAREDIKPETFFVDSIKKENAGPSLITQTKPDTNINPNEKPPSALDLRTGTAIKRSHPDDEDPSGVSKSKIPKRRPTDQELALNYFIKQLSLELLDRRLTIVQQPRHRLAQLEAACRRQFPNFNEREIRLKIRGQLKLYRRNLKKAEERKQAKAGAFGQSAPAFEFPPLATVDQNPSYLSCNPNAVWMARKALANERKRVRPLSTSTPEIMPLKTLTDWQNINSVAPPIVVNKPLPIIRPNISSENVVGSSNSVFSVPPKRTPSNTNLQSPMGNVASPLKPIQASNTETPQNSLKTLLEVNKATKTPEVNSSMESSVLNLTGSDDSQSRQLNQTWPPPSLDTSSSIIASCLRLAANFLLQSATFFESKSVALPDGNHPTPMPPLPPANTAAPLNPPLQPPNLPVLLSSLFGGSLPSIPALGSTNSPLPTIPPVCSTPPLNSLNVPLKSTCGASGSLTNQPMAAAAVVTTSAE